MLRVRAEHGFAVTTVGAHASLSIRNRWAIGGTTPTWDGGRSSERAQAETCVGPGFAGVTRTWQVECPTGGRGAQRR